MYLINYERIPMKKANLTEAISIQSLKTIRSPEDIGDLIHFLRKQRNLTQTELAKLTGIKQQTISAIENGLQQAEVKTLFSILSALNLEIVIRPRTQRTQGFAPGAKESSN